MKHYRYNRNYLGVDKDGFIDLKSTFIELTEYEEVSKTPCGYWIKARYDKKRFILKDSKKKYAYPSKKEAWNSFKIRTKKSVSHCELALKNSEKFLSIINTHELIDGEIKKHK